MQPHPQKCSCEIFCPYGIGRKKHKGRTSELLCRLLILARLDAELLLETLGEIRRTAEAYHIADLADAVSALCKHRGSLFESDGLNHFVGRYIAQRLNFGEKTGTADAEFMCQHIDRQLAVSQIIFDDAFHAEQQVAVERRTAQLGD